MDTEWTSGQGMPGSLEGQGLVLVTPLAPWHMYALSSDICKLGPPMLCMLDHQHVVLRSRKHVSAGFVLRGSEDTLLPGCVVKTIRIWSPESGTRVYQDLCTYL